MMKTIPFCKYKLIIGGLTLIAYLPLKALYCLSDFIYILVYYVIRYRRPTVIHNLDLVFHEKSVQEKREIEKKFYRHFCDCIVETIKLLHISNKEINKRVEVTNGDLIEKIAADQRPIILFLGHYGNWEWAQAISLHYKQPEINGQVYRPVRDEVMDKVMLRIRSRFHSSSIPQKEVFRTLLSLKKENKQTITGFISDQRPNSNNLYYWTTFLGQETAYNIGGEEIGKRIDANYVYLEVEKIRRGHYKMSFKLVEPEENEKDHPYSLMFMQMMEETILRKPEYWLWTHKRWRFSNPNTLNNIKEEK